MSKPRLLDLFCGAGGVRAYRLRPSPCEYGDMHFDVEVDGEHIGGVHEFDPPWGSGWLAEANEASVVDGMRQSYEAATLHQAAAIVESIHQAKQAAV